MWCSIAHLPLPPILPQSSLRKNTPKIQTSCSPSEHRRQIPQSTDASAPSSGRGGRRKRSPSSSPTWRRSSMSRNHCVRWTTYNCRRHSPTLAAVLKSRPIALSSEYLRERCPGCFGDLKHHPNEVADLMVCIDACFTQKKKKSQRDPPKFHHNTHFVPESVASQTEEYVDRCAAAAEEEDETPQNNGDGGRGGRRIRARAALASLHTAVMALLCRHDRVLWVVNMHSAGEKQFNVVALMETLFQHLPHNIRVGLLYDVACTFERSCRKWGFLSRFLDRLAFAVSVFHAFGHEWACQLLYHPRKRVGFGFTNGEGCERFWHSISHLIAHLRICGYHNRLYTLDAQIEHADEASLLRLGGWRVEATKALAECGYPIATLRTQWLLQVTAQTKPLPKRSKNSGQQAVSNIILLRGSLKTRQQQLAEARAAFVDAAEAGRPEAEALQMDVEAAEAALKETKEKLRRKEGELGVTERQDLKKLLSSQYMRLVMNARALKLRLVQRLQHRKFEMDPVERACRRLLNDAKLHTHTEAAVKRREPNISRTCSEYNKLCTQLQKLINEGQAPRNAIAPLPIPAKGLWKLDVDDVIFQNVGLDEREAGEAANEPPLWLSDERVRTGIKAMLELDRCEEEDARLRRERRALQVWFAEEWEVINRALQDASALISANYP
ncbi:hypothetical protein B0H16DRAFT_1669851 [Mycena metata]|uniref:CxC1-like cysteine cluster associated with KDZ transposases domain-containing protein n=1 Tax=Mycena metata TaxID=1033252 RepID=A0AAD7DGF3_9AGAR|nr:hypothetical protein B0H16DRAFT_1669851 [Mycena metata]